MRLVVINGQTYVSIDDTKDLARIASFISGSQVVTTPKDPKVYPLRRKRYRVDRSPVVCDNDGCGKTVKQHGLRRHKSWCDTATPEQRAINAPKNYGRK